VPALPSIRLRAALPSGDLPTFLPGAKENLEGWCRDLASRGIFALTIDAHLHGERSIAGFFTEITLPPGRRIQHLGSSTSIAHTVKDIPVILDALAHRRISMPPVAVTGVHGGQRSHRSRLARAARPVVASIVGAVDFWWT